MLCPSAHTCSGNVELCLGMAPPPLRAFGFIFKELQQSTLLMMLGANTGPFSRPVCAALGFKGKINSI